MANKGKNRRQSALPTVFTRIASLLVIVASVVGCHARIGDYVSASSIARNGFARDTTAMRRVDGREIRVWGFVDHRNLYGDAAAKRILGDWWGGVGPSATSWRFDLMAEADDEVGQGFQVRVPNDPGRDNLLRAFVVDAKAGRPTKVFVKGTLHTFDAPTNGVTLTGLYLELGSSGDIRLEFKE